MLVFASTGALIFAQARGVSGLMLGRALIGLGMAGVLVSGVKAIADLFSPARRPLANGAFIAFGAAGAIVATAPLEWMLAYFDWRQVFVLLAGATATVALLLLLAPDDAREPAAARAASSASLRTIYVDPRFWRLAPVSALCIGSAWALQGLWAAPWLADVALLERVEVVRHLLTMAIALCVGALLIGLLADAARRCGIGAETILLLAASLFVAAEVALVTRVHLPSIVLWAAIAAMGGTTVLSYALLADFFPREIAGRANAALNMLHIGSACAIQSMIGLIVCSWPRDAAGHYPASAYQAALLTIIIVQVVAIAWFVRPFGRTAMPAKPVGVEG